MGKEQFGRSCCTINPKDMLHPKDMMYAATNQQARDAVHIDSLCLCNQYIDRKHYTHKLLHRLSAACWLLNCCKGTGFCNKQRSQKAMPGMAVSSGASCHMQHDRQQAVYQGCPKQGQQHLRGNAVQLRHTLQQPAHHAPLQMPCCPGGPAASTHSLGWVSCMNAYDVQKITTCISTSVWGYRKVTTYVSMTMTCHREFTCLCSVGSSGKPVSTSHMIMLLELHWFMEKAGCSKHACLECCVMQ